MHRHGYKGRKFGRETGPRQSLIKSLADALIQNESIETTLPKAKEVITFTEKLITTAKAGGLHNRRKLISSMHSLSAAHKLFDAIAPQLTKRPSGHFRIVKTDLRRGDNAQMARVSFVDKLEARPSPQKADKSAKLKLKKKPIKSTKATKLPKELAGQLKAHGETAGKAKASPKANQAKTHRAVGHTRSGER